MEVEPFLVERFMDRYEHEVELNLAETCVDPFTLDELLRLVGREDFLEELKEIKLTYGYVGGLPELREALSRLYRDLGPEHVLVSRGAIEANFTVFFSLVKPGSKVISIFPAYQQLYSLPKAFGAEVKLLRLEEEKDWLPDLDELRKLAKDGADLIVINNPHNPTGSLMDRAMLEEVCDLANEVDALVLSDESYHGLWLRDSLDAPSMLDVCDRAIVTRSFSKSLALTGLRLGWIAARNKEVLESLVLHRDYTTISASILLEHIALLAVRNLDRVMERNLGIVRRNFRILSDWMEGQELLSWVPPRAGTVAFIHQHLGISSEDLALRLIQEKGVLLVPGSAFGFDEHLRMGFGGRGEHLEEGLMRFSDLMAEL